MAAGLPYVTLPSSSELSVQPYGVLVMLGVSLGALVAVLVGRRRGLTGEDLGVLLPSTVGAALVAGHLFDVAWYDAPSAAREQGRWLRFTDGHSLVGALAGVAVVALIVAAVRRLDRRRVADVLSIGALVALAIGRIGCALVHDHLGVATDAVVGVDMPAYLARGDYHRPAGVDVLRVHDVGLDELLVLLALVPVAFALLRRWRTRPGLTAAAVAIAYAVVRFGVDFLRLPSTEPTRGGLTGGQWGMVVMLGVAVVGLVRARRAVVPVASARYV